MIVYYGRPDNLLTKHPADLTDARQSDLPIWPCVFR